MLFSHIFYLIPLLSLNHVITKTIANSTYEGCYEYPNLVLERDKESGISTKKIEDDKIPPVYFNGLTKKNLPSPYISDQLNVNHCVLLCQYLNFTWSALMNGSECRCGNTLLPSSFKSDEENCKTKCSGDMEQNCGGGSNFTSIYTTGYTSTGETNKHMMDNTQVTDTYNNNEARTILGLVVSRVISRYRSSRKVCEIKNKSMYNNVKFIPTHSKAASLPVTVRSFGTEEQLDSNLISIRKQIELEKTLNRLNSNLNLK
ncbi:hypothetical protein K502DRAFT_352157 [Neoconidiobolus thromboides FSU 785]|nr:hypothetical protein K502DRAFT_352157 [Neoconidiobolus thromboides FSU 785]